MVRNRAKNLRTVQNCAKKRHIDQFISLLAQSQNPSPNWSSENPAAKVPSQDPRSRSSGIPESNNGERRLNTARQRAASLFVMAVRLSKSFVVRISASHIGESL